ncbi:MAG: hypothetical protein CM1200mP20_13220 [Pseudomonadota bacterium]|nr:MAG: hypothetical protein CM1200mP20_13220 [Pseudomonadota bacterium]
MRRGALPTTEANFGDGVFPHPSSCRGRIFGIGSDSQVCTAPSEELKLLEYAQRLSLQRRTVLVKDDEGSVGRSLVELDWQAATGHWARDLGAGSRARADLLELETARRPRGVSSDQVLDSWIFAGSRTGDVSNVSSAAGTWWSMVCMPCWNPRVTFPGGGCDPERHLRVSVHLQYKGPRMNELKLEAAELTSTRLGPRIGTGADQSSGQRLGATREGSVAGKSGRRG